MSDYFLPFHAFQNLTTFGIAFGARRMERKMTPEIEQ